MYTISTLKLPFIASYCSRTRAVVSICFPSKVAQPSQSRLNQGSSRTETQDGLYETSYQLGSDFDILGSVHLSSFCCPDTRFTLSYAAPFTACAAAWRYKPLAFDNDSEKWTGMAVISFTTEI